jgi:hypothetical protein
MVATAGAPEPEGTRRRLIERMGQPSSASFMYVFEITPVPSCRSGMCLPLESEPSSGLRTDVRSSAEG